MENGSPRYKLKYWFEWIGPCLWAANDKAHRTFDYPIEAENLPLSPETVKRIDEMIKWHDAALNWESPSDPGPWRQDECDRFNQAVIELYQKIQNELGSQFEVVNCQSPLMKDPERDEYLKDPPNFRCCK